MHKPRAGSCSLPLHTDGLEPLGPELLLPALLGPCLTPGTMKQQVFWTGLEYTCRLLGITTAAGKTLPPSSGPLCAGLSRQGCPGGGHQPVGDGQNTWPHLLHFLPPNPRNTALQGSGRCSGVSLGLGCRSTVQNLCLATHIPCDFGDP